MDKVDCIVIGAGVVGLGIARALAQSGFETIIVEKEKSFGLGISARNSEVIHAGIYYPPASLKATFCVAGRQELYAYCIARSIPHNACGKLIVATSPAQLPELETILQRAAGCGVDDLYFLDAAAINRKEPEIACVAGLLSPSTGIIDSHRYMLSLLSEAEAAGALVAYATTVSRIDLNGRDAAIFINGEAMPTLEAGLIVNAAGLDAIQVAKSMTGFPADQIPQGWRAKGTYFMLTGRCPFTRLIYPVPEPGGLGVHLTLDLAGRARFGPDVEWVDSQDFTVDPGRAERFYGAIRRYWPKLRDGALEPGYAGIRPKLSGPGEPAADFVIAGMAQHGVSNVINLFGIESPGLTASLAIADEVLRLATEARATN